MEQWRTAVVIEVGPTQCRVSAVEEQNPAHAFAAATGQPLPTGDYGFVATYDQLVRTHATYTREAPTPLAAGGVRSLVDLVLSEPGRHRPDADIAAAVVITRPHGQVDPIALIAEVLPGVPVREVDALDLIGRGGVTGDVLATVHAGTTEPAGTAPGVEGGRHTAAPEPLVHWTSYDDLGNRLVGPHTTTVRELAALVHDDPGLGHHDATGITRVIGEAATPVVARLQRARIRTGPFAEDPIYSSAPARTDHALAAHAALSDLTWPPTTES